LVTPLQCGPLSRPIIKTLLCYGTGWSNSPHRHQQILYDAGQVGIEYTELGRIPFNSEKEQNSRKALIHRNPSEFKV
jgi:hypothetical protein